MRLLKLIVCLLVASGVYFPSDTYASDIDITIRHIDRSHSQGIVDTYRVKSMDELKSISIDTNLGKYAISELGTTHYGKSFFDIQKVYWIKRWKST